MYWFYVVCGCSLLLEKYRKYEGENDGNGTFSLVGTISPQERDVKPIFTMEGEQLLLPSFVSPLVLGGREVPCVLCVCVCSGRILSFYDFLFSSSHAPLMLLHTCFALAVFLDLKLGIVLLGTYLASKGLVVSCLGGGALNY